MQQFQPLLTLFENTCPGNYDTPGNAVNSIHKATGMKKNIIWQILHRQSLSPQNACALLDACPGLDGRLIYPFLHSETRDCYARLAEAGLFRRTGRAA